VTGRPLVVLGDSLLDRDVSGRVARLSPDAPVPVVDDLTERARPGGASLAALLASSDGREVVLVTALATDAGGAELAGLLAAAGVDVIDLGLTGPMPEKVRVRSDGRTLLRLDRGPGAPGAVGAPTARARAALASAGGVLVADYGRGLAAEPGLRAALAALSRRTPLVWDPHPRGPEPVPGATMATPNAAEAAHFAPAVGSAGLAGHTERARSLRRRWAAGSVSVTLSAAGALLVEDDDAPPLVIPAPAVPCFDSCGAGDRYASAAAGLLADGALPSEAVAGAVAASSAFVAAGGAAGITVPAPPACAVPESAATLVERVRRAGGTVVATGGCFDLLHAGHVSLLRAARALGDCLVVLLNSDESVRRLKGADRPLVPQADRAAVLSALGCVDAVEIFDERTPEAALDRLRPDIFAKGGDYALSELPEAATVARWGGQAVVLPYLEGRSTTSILQEAARRD
jgi:D-beta-D-heptose 7-phosphate kinase/D-beta-D-heptose 1-phosphate adenosyltransferase